MRREISLMIATCKPSAIKVVHRGEEELTNPIARNASTSHNHIKLFPFLLPREERKREKKKRNRSAGALASALPSGALACRLE